MRVLVVTGIRIYRDGIADLLRALPDVVCVATAASASAAISAARRQECDVAMLDMTTGTIGTIAALLAARPHLRVVALGVQDEGPEVVACAKAGVSGYVSRDASFDELADALRSAVRGEVACSGRIAAALSRHIWLQANLNPVFPIDVALTRREREVLRLIQSDMSNKEIARALDLQLSTVKNHVHHVLTKCGAAGRGEVARRSAQYLEDADTLT